MWSRERDTPKCGSHKGSGGSSPWRLCSAKARTALPVAALANRAEIASSAGSRDEGAGDRLLPLDVQLDRSVPLFTPTIPGSQRQGISVLRRPRRVTWGSWPRKQGKAGPEVGASPGSSSGRPCKAARRWRHLPRSTSVPRRRQAPEVVRAAGVEGLLDRERGKPSAKPGEYWSARPPG